MQLLWCELDSVVVPLLVFNGAETCRLSSEQLVWEVIVVGISQLLRLLPPQWCACGKKRHRSDKFLAKTNELSLSSLKVSFQFHLEHLDPPTPTWDSFTDCHINWGPVSLCLLWTEWVEDRWQILGVSSASWSSKFPRPTDTAVSGARRRWSGSLCCSSLCRICNWSSCPCRLGCGSTSAGTGTTPGEGCMCTDTAATCLWWSGRPGSQ